MAELPRRIRTVIADDEPVARDLLRSLLERDPEVELVAECANGAQALEAVRAHAPDLVVLDVQMPGMDGFEVVEALEDEGRALPLVVFATAHDRHALRAFEVQAVDYVLKPFDPARMADALRRAKERLRGRAVEGMKEQLAALLALLGKPEPVGDPAGRGRWLERLAIQRGNRIEYIDVGEIAWIEAADQYVRVHTEGREHLMRGSMSQLERELDPARFARVHRSAIVALDRVKALETAPDGSARVSLGKDRWLPVGRARLAGLRERLG